MRRLGPLAISTRQQVIAGEVVDLIAGVPSTAEVVEPVPRSYLLGIEQVLHYMRLGAS